MVNVDAMVLTKDGQHIPGLKKEHFRVLEDGVEQKIANFGVTQAPFTAVLLIEFASTYYQMMYDALNASYAFADQLRPNDYVAVVEFDMKPQILVDFTNDKRAVFGALNTLRIPGFRETNVFDALYDTLDRLDRIEGRKEIILVSAGVDTFSKITYDKVLKKIKDTPNVTIFCISTGFLLRERYASSSSFGATLRNMDFLQADNEMQTFARMTGGRFFQPRFQGELPTDFREISDAVRNQYTISYHPTNNKQDGSYRKLKVELVAPGTDKPLIIRDQKNKELKYQVVARDGYTAKHQVE
jgi:VWFA-related protein